VLTKAARYGRYLVPALIGSADLLAGHGF